GRGAQRGGRGGARARPPRRLQEAARRPLPRRAPAHGLDAAGAEDAAARAVDKEAVRVIMAAAANDPGERGGSRAARWLLAPPSCGASLRLPLSLPGSFASLATMTRTDA